MRLLSQLQAPVGCIATAVNPTSRPCSLALLGCDRQSQLLFRSGYGAAHGVSRSLRRSRRWPTLRPGLPMLRRNANDAKAVAVGHAVICHCPCD